MVKLKKRIGIILLTVNICMVVMSTVGLSREKIVICGTGDSQELLRTLAKTFEKSNPGTKVEVPDSIGSSGGIKTIEKGECDLGRVARPLNDKEKQYNLSYKVFAYSPVVFIVHQDVKRLKNITSQQVVDIYSGKIVNWKDLGSIDAKIYVANREAGDSSRSILEKNIPGLKDIQNLAGETVYSTPETTQTILKYKSTIGYGPLSMVEGPHLTVLKFEGVAPSVENVQNGTYKLVTSFGIVWKENVSKAAKSFLDFLFTPEAQNIIIKNGAVPVNLQPQKK